MNNPPSPLLEMLRGGLVESTHFGSIAVVDPDGRLLYSVGDPNTVAFLRSSAKPFQILPFVEGGGLERFGFTQKELALACASHETAQIHLDAVAALQEKVGVRESDLQCGPHLPSDADMLRRVIKEGIRPTANYNNCSGKHTAMLACAKMRGLPLDDYLSPDHPIQRDILAVLSDLSGLPPASIRLGVDGCSAPNFALPLFNAALAMARFCDPRGLGQVRAEACGQIASAMTAHPEMVSNFGEFDCELMKVGGGKIITKRGAEGFQILGLLPGVIGERGLGIAFKATDGDPGRMNDSLEARPRVRPAVTLEILRQLDALDEEQLKRLAAFGPKRVLKNYAGLVTGESRPAFELAAQYAMAAA
ncbi:MAG: asparaginase [Anaerolineaceae bacterium]|nr:asparaginase [Anaerolineae bacterium]MBL1172427.1 asparaginase [Chloroflexota bacterium]MDL1925644.1 asparaginase [Anaerolineae bacterium AMX1]WKZ54553.1 MAG: asparaginase [Anaerolineales bacterium]GJQ39092.1 MAG: asparaginase [Anaerolineaceae bacterium]